MFDIDDRIELNIEFPPKLEPFYTKHAKFKVAYGGRGASKSWTIARMLLLLGLQKPLRILCARETMTSIADSVHQLLSDQIGNLNLENFYRIERDNIKGVNGTIFRFAGIRKDINQIKSFEGIDICWIEEAANVTSRSWDVLLPTIRKKGHEIWVSFNPDFETDNTFQRFVADCSYEDIICVKINYTDNPWLAETTDLLPMIEESRLNDPPETYRHIWLGECRANADGAVYAREIAEAESEDQPGGSRFTKVRFDPHGGECQAFWDIGISDATAIWVAQRVAGEIHLIDYLEDTGHAVDWYVRELLHRGGKQGYIVKKHWLPHDAKARSYQTGMTTEEVLRKTCPSVGIVPRVSLQDGINAVRMVFRQLWFDKKLCGDGIRAIRNYRFETRHKYDPRTGIPIGGFKPEPEHSIYSHGSDALRYLALVMRPPKAIPSKDDGGDQSKYDEWMSKFQRSSTSWMNNY